MAKSRLIQINNYALLEMTYEETTINTSKSSFNIIDNTIQEYYQFLNVNGSASATGNVLDRSSVQLGGNQWVRTEQDIPIPYLTTDERFDVTPLSTAAPGLQWPVTYDKVRVHILSGYTFTSSSGFVLEVQYPEANGVKSSKAGAITYVNGDSYINFSTTPFVLNGAAYDKYVEFSIPSLSELVTEYQAEVDKTDALAYYLTSDNEGFLVDGLINFNFYEITEVNNINGYDYLTTGVPISFSLEQQDQYSNLAAVIKQNGDYFEYYPIWDEQFIQEYIAILNEVKGRYVVIHELTVSEQVGFSQILSSSNVILQTDDFDQPSLFKPILKNADTAFSFSIDYTMRLTNETDGSQIIRTASVTCFEPKRFGKNSLKLKVREDVLPYKVFNKVTNGPVFNMPATKQDIRVQRVIAPSFYENNNVSVSTGKLFISKSGEYIPEKLFEWDIIFGQTEAIILVSPFDNYFKFNVFRVTADSIETLDLSSAQEINLVFETTGGRKYRYALYQPFPTNQTAIVNQINNPKNGELIFRLPADDATRMLTDLPGKFYITVRNQNVVKARVSLDIASELRGKEVSIKFQDWAQKSDDDIVNIIYNLNTYSIEKRYLEVIEIVPDGLTGEETVIYKGNVETADNYEAALAKVEELRNGAFSVRLKAIKEREAALDEFQKQLNAKESQLNAKESTLKSLEIALIGQQQTLQDQTESLVDQRTELDKRNSLIKQREDELARLLEEAKKGQSSSIKELSEIIETLRRELERLRNQGTGNQGTGNQGTGNQGTGNQGPQGGGGANINADALIGENNWWRRSVDDFIDMDGRRGAQGGNSNKTVQSYYDTYYVNTTANNRTFIGRYEIKSDSSTNPSEREALFNKEFINDPRTNGGVYTELKKNQPRTFQAGETAYLSKWFVDKDERTENKSDGGTTSKIKIAVLEFGTEGFTNVSANPEITQYWTEDQRSIVEKYTRTVGSLSGFKIEVALDGLYDQGKDDVKNGKDTFLAGYSKFIDKLTVNIIEKQIPTVTNKTNESVSSRTYLYNQNVKYFNSLVSAINDNREEVGFKVSNFAKDNDQLINIDNKNYYGWDGIFTILSGNKGAGSFTNVRSSIAYGKIYKTDFILALAKFYDELLTSLFNAKTNNNQVSNTALLSNLIILEGQKSQEKPQTVRYVRMNKNTASGISAAYALKEVAVDFLGVAGVTVYNDEVFPKELPASLISTVGGVEYTYDKTDPYQVSDWISGFPVGTLKDSWIKDAITKGGSSGKGGNSAKPGVLV